MHTLLIVEDEKMIRQGIKAMALRSGVPFSEVIECRNGEEGLEALRTRRVDLMITDIRMPHMDGIELIHQAKREGIFPVSIVISGYDDFSYAVELLRAGVRDYILKPVERDKLSATLQKIAAELVQSSIERSNEQQLSLNQLKYLLLNPSLPADEVNAVVHKFSALRGDAPYHLYCLNQAPDALDALSEGVIVLSNIEQQTVLYCPQPEADAVEQTLSNCCAGKSACSPSIRDMHTAFAQAFEARVHAYCMGSKGATPYAPTTYAEPFPSGLPERHAQALSADSFEPIRAEWRSLALKLKQGRVDGRALPSIINELLGRITSSYQSVVPVSDQDLACVRHPFKEDTLDQYLLTLMDFLSGYHATLSEQLCAYHNRQKIERARAYIDKNVHKELNMAIVSNEVSMNYSLFSTLFKRYIGEGFSTYIKRLRVEKAKELLRDTDMLVIEIGRKVGYENDKHFLKLFKNACGVSPGEYRAFARMHEDE